MPRLLHWDLACWSLQEQRKSCRQSGSQQAVLPALETPQKLKNSDNCTQPLNYFKAGREGYVHSIQIWPCILSCKVLYQSTWQSPGISNLWASTAAKKTESRTQLCFPPTPSYSCGLMLAQMLLGRVVKQIGKPIKLRTSLGFWHHMDVILRRPPCLCNQWAAESQHSPADGRQASWVSFRSSQLLAFIWATRTQLWTSSSSEPHGISELCKRKCVPGSPESTKSVKATHDEV